MMKSLARHCHGQPRRAGRTVCSFFKPLQPILLGHYSVTKSSGINFPASTADLSAPGTQVHLAAGALLLAAGFDGALAPAAAHALELHVEPSNALSLPTWAIQ